MKKKNVNPLVKSSVIYIIATAIGQGVTFLGVMVFTRLMPKNDYGLYSTYYANVALFVSVIGINMYYSLNNAYIDKANRIKEYCKSALFLSTCIAVPITLLITVLGMLLFHYSAFILILMGLHSFSFFLVNYRMFSANMENDYMRKQWLLSLPYVLQFLFAFLLVILFPQNTFTVRVIGSTLGVATVGIWGYIEIIRYPGRLINKDDWKYGLSISIPSIVMSLSYQLMQQCDKVMITGLCSAEETAEYSVIYYLGYAMIAVNMAVAPVRQAWIYKKLSKKELDSTRTLQKGYLFLFAVLATLVMMFGEIAVKIIAPPNYWQFGYIVPFVVSACMMVLYPFYTEIILFYKKNFILSMSILSAAIVNIILNALFIPTFGAVTACYTTVISYFMVFVTTSIIAERYVKNVYSKKYFAVFLLWLVLISAVSFISVNKPLLRYTLYTGVLIVLALYAWRNKDEFKMLIKSKKKYAYI